MWLCMTDSSGCLPRAAQLRALSAAELGWGRPAAALRAAEQARDALSAGPRTAAHWLTLQAQGAAASLLGQHAMAIDNLTAARVGLTQLGFPAASESMIRARRLEAEALLRSRQDDERAARQFNEILADLRASPRPHALEMGRTLDAVGCIALLAGRPTQARERFDEAVRSYELRVGHAHPLPLRSAALRAFQASEGPSAAIARYHDTFASDSPLRNAKTADCRDLL
jgi:hypothetical protein